MSLYPLRPTVQGLILLSLMCAANTALAANKSERDALTDRNDLPKYLSQSEVITRPLIRQLQQNPTYQPTPAVADEFNKKLEKLNVADLFREYIAALHSVAQGKRRVGKKWSLAQATFKRLAAAGDGSATKPIPVLSGAEAFAYAQMDGATVLGGIYQIRQDLDLYLILLVARGVEQGHKELYFKLKAVSAIVKESQNTANHIRMETLITQLAQAGDEWAMATVGESLRRHTKLDDKTIFWLGAAHQQGNLIGTLLLAKLHLGIDSQINGTGQPKPHRRAAQDLYLQAIARNSDAAMAQLGRIYYQGLFGLRKISIGLSLLEQARALSNIDALLTLAEIYRAQHKIWVGEGELLSLHSIVSSAKMLQEAGDAGHRGARLAYAQLYVNHDKGQKFNRRAFRWLQELATAKESTQYPQTLSPETQAEALLLLGWVSARGLIAKRNFDKAKDYWLQAAERHASPKILNEIAYILVAIDTPELRDADNALRLIEKLMTETGDQEIVNHYAYLDTWASVYAAKGLFDRAIEIQQRALQALVAAGSQTNDTEQKMLEEHLRAFRRGELIYDVGLY